ncbi:transporter [uncultured Imperialibacter sp.]|uniref:transporter n=1 Tax=uncultured Imperialibacter sp. TaxID=1672639 RepID=UPI0030DCF8F3|tara:strand:+ start:429 stop:1355 length:927 start_codon:yes stop_codon:yes gene_type:complete
MKSNKYILFGISAFVIGLTQVAAQTPTDAFMMKQRESCVALIYDMSSFDHYWEGDLLRVNQTIETVTRNTVLPMIAIGLHDKVNLIVATPYVKTKSSEPNGGKFAGAKGFQDIGISLKGELMNKQLGPGKLALLTTVSFSTPMSNYLSDYMPYSLGFGAPEFGARGIVHYQLDKGIYARVTGAHLWRGQTEAERDYYYNNGSYYTALMDVPDAWNYQAVVGSWLWNYTLKVECNYQGLMSTSGDDIRKYNAAQPTNKVEFGQVGLTAQYYPKAAKGLGALVYYSQRVSGKNTAKSNNLGVGLTYQFKI